MTNDAGKSVLDAIHFVRDFHRTAAKMLLAADTPLSEAGWVPHGKGWKPIPGARRSLGKADRWMPHYIIRQYRLEDDVGKKELLTLGVIPFDPVDNRLEEPLCLASRMRTKTLDGDQLYWVPQLQLRCRDGFGPLGEVRRISREQIEYKAHRAAAFDQTVEGSYFISILQPLMAVVDEESLRALVLEPILSQELPTSG